MVSTRTAVRTALLALSLFYFSVQSSYALTLPIFGKVTFGNEETTPASTPLKLDVLFGYRSTPQYYTVNEDTVEIRALVVNSENKPQTTQYETKMYRVTSVWDTKTHAISYEKRFEYINAESEDEAYVFGENALRDLFLDSRDCAIRQDEFCYRDINAEDADNAFGGVTVDIKPEFVHISEPITVAANERINIATEWSPETCGYYRVIVQPFGYSESFSSDTKTRDAYIRVKGCEQGEILDYGAVAIAGSPQTGIGEALGATTDLEHLPMTGFGFETLLLSVSGVVGGGSLVHLRMRSKKTNKRKKQEFIKEIFGDYRPY